MVTPTRSGPGEVTIVWAPAGAAPSAHRHTNRAHRRRMRTLVARVEGRGDARLAIGGHRHVPQRLVGGAALAGHVLLGDPGVAPQAGPEQGDGGRGRAAEDTS